MNHQHDEHCKCDSNNDAKVLRQKLRMKREQMQNSRLSNTARTYKMEIMEKKMDAAKQKSLFKNPADLPVPMEEDNEDKMAEDVNTTSNQMVEDKSL